MWYTCMFLLILGHVRIDDLDYVDKSRFIMFTDSSRIIDYIIMIQYLRFAIFMIYAIRGVYKNARHSEESISHLKSFLLTTVTAAIQYGVHCRCSSLCFFSHQ